MLSGPITPWTRGLAIVLLTILATQAPAAPSDVNPPKKHAPSVLWIGLDGADQNLLQEWALAGYLPTIAGLMKEGAYAVMDVDITPAFSPNIWTSIFTGQRPERHGVQSDMGIVDIPSQHRKTKAIWNILNDQGLTIGSVNHLVTWPAEHVRGAMLSRLFRTESIPRVLYPETLRPAIQARIKAHEQEIRSLIAPLDRYRSVEIRPSEAADGTLKHYLDERQKDLNCLQVAEEDAEALEAGLYLLENETFDFFTIYFGGCDVLGHRFFRYMPPIPDYIPDEDVQNYGNILRDYYVMVDGFIKRLLVHAGDETTVVLCSDHGMRKTKPLSRQRLQEGRPPGNHSSVAVAFFKGPRVKKGHLVSKAGLMDLTPTVLYLQGLPVARDFDGKVLTDIVEPSYLQNHPIRWVNTFGPPAYISLDYPLSNIVTPDEQERLRSLGYLK